MQSKLPAARMRSMNDLAVRSEGRFVLYWMTAQRRPVWNHALDRALEYAQELGKPLLVLEALRVGYPWASDRMHRFVMDGMRDQARAFGKAGVRYYAYVERAVGEGKGLLAHVAKDACVVVADDWPHFFLPRMLQAAARQVPVRLEAVDSVGLWPIRGQGPHVEKPFARAYDFRRYLQKNLGPALVFAPKANPLARQKLEPVRMPQGTEARWPEADDAWLADPANLAALPIDHSVAPTGQAGGALEAGRYLKTFVARHLADYGEGRTDLDRDRTSGLSPYLHFGHVSAHQILGAIASHEAWNMQRVLGTPKITSGARNGWWQMRESAEAYMDQLVTWRELGFHRSAYDASFGTYAGLPDWARLTLAEHAQDARPKRYTPAQFEAAETHDDLWNAAQQQLITEGTIHNYLRMLWGKKILHWSRSPEEAFDTMVHLNNRYALDGRDPNSYSGISWVLGLFDRAWGPEREVFGKIRYMSSDNTRRKLRVKDYIQRHSPRPSQGALFE
ncbi:MAG: deoxyribodipyrimidine photolyase [Planctomycetes bacterium]|nr:deoxyribodipyrimidine photolyase [Planctomycetota bacterium]